VASRMMGLGTKRQDRKRQQRDRRKHQARKKRPVRVIQEYSMTCCCFIQNYLGSSATQIDSTREEPALSISDTEHSATTPHHISPLHRLPQSNRFVLGITVKANIFSREQNRDNFSSHLLYELLVFLLLASALTFSVPLATASAT
jgi:hypothetical protein